MRTLLTLKKLSRNCWRKYSTSNKIQKSVIISESNDIYTNLALEDWYYKNWKWNDRHVLILWSNNPCVVIGKFQNPWLESNVSDLGYLIPEGVKLARRNSGGGTVYHDRGNLNLTFFTPREHYNRKHNLNIIAQAVRNEYNLNVEITKRDDLVIGDCKVSGTAAKLARTTAYHHCTLLVNSNKELLHKSLKKPRYEIKTNATRSTSSKILNLADINPNITIEQLMVCIGEQYLATAPLFNEKTQDDSSITNKNEDFITKFRILQPTEKEYPGLTDIRDSLIGWDWLYGTCPKFTASKSLSDGIRQVKIIFTVENGKVSAVDVEFPVSSGIHQKILHEEFKTRKFTEELFDEVYRFIFQQKSIVNTV